MEIINKYFRIIYFLNLLLLPHNYMIANETDSLKSLLENSGGKKKIELIIEIMEKLERNDPESAIKYGNEALNFLKKNPDKELQAEIIYRKAWAYIFLDETDSVKKNAELVNKISNEAGFEKGRIMSLFLKARLLRDQDLYTESLDLLNQADEINKTVEDKKLEIKILNEKGSVQRRLSNYNEALNLHKKALELLEDFKDEDELITTHTYLGILYSILGDFDESLNHYHISLNLNKKLNDKRGIAAAVHNIGILYQKINNFPLSLEYFDQAEQYWKELNNENNLAATYNSIGAVHELQNSSELALQYYRRALEIWEKLGYKSSVSIALNNIASILETFGNHKEAKNYIHRAIKIREEIGDKNGYSGSMVILSIIYNKLGMPDSAIAVGKEALKTSLELGSLTTIRQAYNSLADIYEKNGLYKEALNEYKNFLSINDSIFNSESQQVIAEMQEKYNSEEQRQEIELLQKENEIQYLYRLILIASFIAVIILLFLLFNRYRLSKKYLLEQQNAHQALQKLHESEVESAELRAMSAETKTTLLQIEFDQKKKELDAARNLQLSMLPSKLPEHPNIIISALMKTANEVGGDYYDFHYSQNGELTIAIGDATGHGAEAGIMVTAVKSLFNLLSSKKDIVEILHSSTYAIKKMQFSNLFMALGILRLYDHQLELAGAGMPPAYIYRATTGNVEVIELKGLPIGIVSDNKYEKKRVKLFKDDVVLLLSDGFPELFNSDRETFGFEKIPDLLKQSGDKSPEEIINYFIDAADKWIDGNKQQDDMTFVVFKVKR